jgi:hypothetical protein
MHQYFLDVICSTDGVVIKPCAARPTNQWFAYWQEQEIFLFSGTSKTGRVVYPASCLMDSWGSFLEG